MSKIHRREESDRYVRTLYRAAFGFAVIAEAVVPWASAFTDVPETKWFFFIVAQILAFILNIPFLCASDFMSPICLKCYRLKPDNMYHNQSAATIVVFLPLSMQLLFSVISTTCGLDPSYYPMRLALSCILALTLSLAMWISTAIYVDGHTIILEKVEKETADKQAADEKRERDRVEAERTKQQKELARQRADEASKNQAEAQDRALQFSQRSRQLLELMISHQETVRGWAQAEWNLQKLQDDLNRVSDYYQNEWECFLKYSERIRQQILFDSARGRIALFYDDVREVVEAQLPWITVLSALDNANALIGLKTVLLQNVLNEFDAIYRLIDTVYQRELPRWKQTSEQSQLDELDAALDEDLARTSEENEDAVDVIEMPKRRSQK